MAAAKKKTPQKAGLEALRREAERRLAKKNKGSDELAFDDTRKLIHELSVHQIELEMQNEELRRAQGEIEESRSRFVDLYDFSPVGYFTLNKRGVVVEANLTAADLLGMARPSLRGLIFSQFVAPEWRDAYLECKSRVFETGAKESFELILRKADGTSFWVAFSCSGLKVWPGTVTGMQCAVSDISARKEKEMEARWAFAYRQAIDNSVLIGLAAWDLEGRQTYVNRTFCRLFGWGEKELVGSESPQPYWPKKEVAAISRAFEEVRGAEKGGRTFELRLRRKNNELSDALVNLSVLKDPEGGVLGWVGSFADITEKKRSEEERLRLAAAVEQGSEGIAITSPEGIISYVNPAFEELAGCSGADLLGKKYLNVLTGGAENAVLKKNLEGAFRCGDSLNTQVSRKNASGVEQELEVTYSPIRDQFGKVINYLAVERDVTQQLKLDQLVRQGQKLEALGTLAGGIAHDFNNILMPIIINTEMALRGLPEGNPTRNMLELALSAASRGKQLVKQIITFSRQKEQGRQPLRLGPLIKETMKLIRSSFPETIEIRQQIQDGNDLILGDPSQIHQIVMNLCNNASQAMREKGGVLEVKLAQEEVGPNLPPALQDLKPGPYLKLTVSDTGPGIKREVLERVFDPFFTTKKPGEGSGMGLSVVLGIVRMLGGGVTAQSELGKGTEFSVYLPLVKGLAPAPEPGRGKITRGKGRILVVDDEKMQLESYQNVLERLGYEVNVKADSSEALALFRKNPAAFDLVITDQIMPKLSGIRLSEEMLLLRPDIPIILCTGYSETVDAAQAKAAGVKAFLMKPFSIQEIAETIDRAINKNSGC